MGVSVDGLRTTVLPVTSAGASLRAGVSSGSFHGVMATTTPTGSRRVCTYDPSRVSSSSSPHGSLATPA
jgi:hypothetical protein